MAPVPRPVSGRPTGNTAAAAQLVKHSCWEDDVFYNAVCSDVKKLHDLAACAKHGGLVASSRIEEQPVDEQINKACQASTSASSRSSCIPSSLCDLLVSKVVEALLCALEDTEEGFFFAGPTASTILASHQRSKGPKSVVATLDALLERIRWFHRQARQAAAKTPATVTIVAGPMAERDADSRASCGCRCARTHCDPGGTSSGDGPRESSLGDHLTCTSAQPNTQPHFADLAVQTDTTLVVERPSAPMQSCATQVESAGLSLHDADTQTCVPHQACESCETSAQTVHTSLFGRHRSVQTERLIDALRDAATQTEIAADRSSETSAVRLVRLAKQNLQDAGHASHRRISLSDSACGCCSSNPAIGVSTANRQNRGAVNSANVKNEKASRKAGRARSGRARLDADVLSTSDSAASSIISEAHVETPNEASRCSSSVKRVPSASSSRLRCPAGHCMQWVQTRRIEGTTRADDLCCSVCGSQGFEGVHCCALCYRDDGQRHTICNTCSRDPFALRRYMGHGASDRSGDALNAAATTPEPTEPPWQVVKPMRKSASTGSVQAYQRRRAADVTLRASEWSQVSASLQKQGGVTSVSSPGRALLNGSHLRMQ